MYVWLDYGPLRDGDTYAAVLAVLKALSSEVDVCRTMVSAPGGVERLIAVMPTTFSTVEEGALLLTSICERGAQSHIQLDELTKAGLVEKMQEIAVALATAPRPQRKVAMKAAEAALMCLPVAELLPPFRPPPPSPPPSPPPNPMPSWRNKMTRNIDSVLPLHTTLPETWKLCDDEGFPVSGDALTGAINALVAECLTQEALQAVSTSTEEAPSCAIAALKCILTVLGDSAAGLRGPFTQHGGHSLFTQHGGHSLFTQHGGHSLFTQHGGHSLFTQHGAHSLFTQHAYVARLVSEASTEVSKLNTCRVFFFCSFQLVVNDQSTR